MSVRVYRNEDVRRVVAFIPEGHRHVRVLVEFSDGIVVLQEATVAAIMRAYIDVVTHPTRRTVELSSVRIKERKEGYAEFQLIETGRRESEVLEEIKRILNITATREP